MDMYNPAHPGEVFKEAFLNAVNLNVTQAAERLGISRKHLSNVINGNASVSADIAKRFEALTGSSAQMWLNMQTNHDLWQLRDKKYNIKKVAA